MRTLRVAFLSALSMDMIAGFGVGFVAMVLGLRLLWGELGLQTAMAVLLVTPEIFIPLRRAGAEFHASSEGQAAAARVIEVLATEIPAGTSSGADAPMAQPAPVRDGHRPTLAIDGLRVDYEHRDHPALTSFSLHAPAGMRLALTGPSGCGKSTVLAALLRFVEPSGGTIALDGRPSGAIDAGAWRSHFSWLPQRPHLFNATLEENLRLGAPAATPADLRRVLADVGLSELLANLPAGLQTALGHDGLTLSAGERQRVALARALLLPGADPLARRAHRRRSTRSRWPAWRRPSSPGSRAAPSSWQPTNPSCWPTSTRRWPCRRPLGSRSRSHRERPPGRHPPRPRRTRHSLRAARARRAPRLGGRCGDHRPAGRLGLRGGTGRLTTGAQRDRRHPRRRGGARLPPRTTPLRGAPRRPRRRTPRPRRDGGSGSTTASRRGCLLRSAGWRSGDLLVRAIDDVDALQDLYLRTLLPVGIAVGAGVIGTVAVGVILPWAALALGLPLALALTVPALLTWRRSGDDEMADLSGALSAQVVDSLQRRARTLGVRGRRRLAARRGGPRRLLRCARAPPRRGWAPPPPWSSASASPRR